MSNHENQNQRAGQNPGYVPPYYTQTLQTQPVPGWPQYQNQAPQSGYLQPGNAPSVQQPATSPFQTSPFIQQQQQPGIGAPGTNMPGMLPIEQSYIENILRLNRGKLVKAYMTFENSPEQQVFQGTIEAAGRDHLILRNPETEERYLLLMVYLDYVVFPERVEYDYPFNGQTPGMLSNTAPRTSGTLPPR